MATLFVDPGALRHQLKLLASRSEPDGMGGFSEVWAEQASLFGRVEPVSALAVFGADQSLESVTHLITLRWRADVASGMRLSKLGRLFDILTAHDPDETGRYLVCRAKEIGR